MDPSCFNVVKKLALEDVEEEGEAHAREEEERGEYVQLALANSVVLREIFKFLPANTLKSCSLVNKLWKSECYSYCRDHRKWMARAIKTSPCTLLVEFNELVGSMTLVPYNGLTFHVDHTVYYNSCKCNSPEESFTNVLDKLTWRHLDILIDFEGDFEESNPIACAALRFGITLLEQKMTGLESLSFQLYDDLQPHISSNWPPALPKLQTICLPQTCQRDRDFRHTALKCFFTRLTQAAPNVKEITGKIDLKMLQLLPEEKWGYVKDLKYSPFITIHDDIEDELKLASKFVSKRPSIRKFRLLFPGDGRPTDDCRILKVLIELSRMTMEEFEIRCYADEFQMLEDSLTIPQLPKLRLLRLDMRSSFEQAIETTQSLLNHNDGKCFPQLEEFQLSVFTSIREHFAGLLPKPELRDESDSDEIGRLELPVQSFPSVSKLQLELDPASSSFVQIKSLFPAVTEMVIICETPAPAGPGQMSRLPHKQIFRLWQDLKIIAIHKDYVDPDYNLDASFCGLDEQEVELLGQEDDSFLLAVQLVPIAPCVLTMLNLQSFSFMCPYGVEASERGPYMTRVGQMLAKRYLPNALVMLPCEDQTPNT